MKALKNAGIDEATLEIGTAINWWSKDFGMMGDAVSYIERDEDGAVTRIGFAGWASLFTNRMKLGVELHDGPYGADRILVQDGTGKRYRGSGLAA